KILRTGTVLKWFFAIVLGATAIMAFNVWRMGLAHNIEDVTIDPLFQAISVISSTGLVEPDFASWGAPVIILIVTLMFIGGCAGSTSGGAKIDRIVICFKNIRNEFYRILHPNAVLTIRINGRGTSDVIVQKAMIFLVLYVLIIIVAAIVLMLIGVGVEQSFIGVLESISNTGLGVDLQGNPTSWVTTPAAAKWILSFVMLVGRLELYTVLVLFTTTFWQR
ncbi:MAG: TrkH family potassium uptake protein, partial [Muribaculaceae bacterium]|nr:TrkH family potassium uptake protein [Muribaculaceae bacterium]